MTGDERTTRRTAERRLSPFVRAFAGAVIGIILTLALVAGGLWIFRDQIAAALNPFATETVERAGPAVLVEMTELSRFVGASGTYEVVVELGETSQDDAWPAWLVGERLLYSARGDVESSVDFGTLGADDVTVSDDGTAVAIRLPAPEVGAPRLDNTAGEFIPVSKGLVDRVGDFFAEDADLTEQALVLAEEEIAAAAAESDLEDRTKQSTRRMLEAMLEPLGFETVTVAFEGDPAPRR